jgi:phospholipase C
VFDHTSTLLFLEKFLSNKFRKKIQEPNISKWRRTICGDLTSAFNPYNGEKISTPEFLERDEFIEKIDKAQFRNPPSNFKKVSQDKIEKIIQEKGIRESNALPYELYADGKLSADSKSFVISMEAGNKMHAGSSAGSPFNVYAPGLYKNESADNWAYAVSAGDSLKDSWSISDFEDNIYHLRVYGPNGFFREFKGSNDDPHIEVECDYEKLSLNAKQLTGNIILKISNRSNIPLELEVVDNSYKTGTKIIITVPGEVSLFNSDLSKSFGWYDLSLRLKENPNFEKRYAGRVENGKPSKTDPAMGKII